MKKQLKTFMVVGDYLLSNGEYKECFEIGEALGLEAMFHLSDKPDVLIYAGGVDINPALYGEKPLALTQSPNKLRDGVEIATYYEGKSYGATHIGICRGAQLLNVLNGGKLWQHVDCHEKDHGIHVKGRVKGDGYYQYGCTTSSHHQVIIPPRNGNEKHNPYHIVAEAVGLSAEIKANQRWLSANTSRNQPPREDIEGIWFPNTNVLGVQFHPGWNKESMDHLKSLYRWWILNWEGAACAA